MIYFSYLLPLCLNTSHAKQVANRHAETGGVGLGNGNLFIHCCNLTIYSWPSIPGGGIV